MGGANKGDETKREKKRKWKSICDVQTVRRRPFSERQALRCQFTFWAISLPGNPVPAKHGYQSSSWEFVSNADSLAPPQTSRIRKVGEGNRPSRFSQAFEWILTHWPKFEHHCCGTSFQGSGCFQETARQLEGICIYRGLPHPRSRPSPALQQAVADPSETIISGQETDFCFLRFIQEGKVPLAWTPHNAWW